MAREGPRQLPNPYNERRSGPIATFASAELYEQKWLAGHDLANEIAWRLTRLHELKHSSDQGELAHLERSLRELLPAWADISEYIAQIQDVGFPSILEVLQEGVGTGPNRRPSALTQGLGSEQPEAFQARFGRLSYQHRMHPDISAFPRELIYDGKSLLDANTIEVRDRDRSAGASARFPAAAPGSMSTLATSTARTPRRSAPWRTSSGFSCRWAEGAGPPAT